MKSSPASHSFCLKIIKEKGVWCDHVELIAAEVFQFRSCYALLCWLPSGISQRRKPQEFGKSNQGNLSFSQTYIAWGIHLSSFLQSKASSSARFKLRSSQYCRKALPFRTLTQCDLQQMNSRGLSRRLPELRVKGNSLWRKPCSEP